MIEMTYDKPIVWEYQAPSGAEVHACQPLPDGRVIAGESGSCRIVEIDRAGVVIKEIDLPVPPPSIAVHDQFRGARRAANGHYFVSAQGQHHVLELDDDGVVLREIPTPSDVHEVVLLPTGNLLISCGDGHKIVELDEIENVVWELNENDVPGNPLRLMAGLQRPPDGNIIFCNYLGHGHVGEQPHCFETTRDKKVVWEFADHHHFTTINQIQVLDIPGDVRRGEIIR